ncbi:MAG TPA: metal-dependent hydrolase [Opitutaceae bacterium]
MKITYLAHSCIHIETGKHKLLIDPFISGNALAPVKANDIDCNYILLTHGHDDHVGDAADIARRTGATIIANYEIATYFGAHGLATHGMYHGGKWDFPFGRVKMVIAHHGSGYSDGNGPLIYMGNPAGFVLTLEGRNIYHAGDTCVFLDMELIARMNPLELAFLPIGDNFTMGLEEATEALRLLRPKKVVPVHYDTWDLIKADTAAFAASAAYLNVEAAVMKPGQVIEI